MRDPQSQADAALHDRTVNNHKNPRLAIDMQQHHAEISSDTRVFGSDPRLVDLRAMLGEAGLGDGLRVSFRPNQNRIFTLLLHRHAGDTRDLDTSEEAYLAALLPHLKQTATLSASQARSQQAGEASLAAADRLRTAVIVCENGLDIAWHNEAASALLQQTGPLRIAANQLRAHRAADAQWLNETAAALLTGAEAGRTRAFAGPNGERMHLHAARLPEPEGALWDMLPPRLAFFLTKPEDGADFESDLVRELFELTPAEARLASAIATGASLAEFAIARGISLGTARFQLKQVLAKTETSRQAELVRALHGSVIGQLRAPRTRYRSPA